MAAKPLGRASHCVVSSGCLFCCPQIKFYRNPWLHPAFCPPVPSATNSNPTRRGPQHLLPCCLYRLNTLLFSPSSRPVARLLWDWDAPVVRDDFFGKAKALLKCLFFFSFWPPLSIQHLPMLHEPFALWANGSEWGFRVSRYLRPVVRCHLSILFQLGWEVAFPPSCWSPWVNY